MNRDKLKFQYTKQDIPDSLKYHSDDSDSSEVSGLRKSKILKKNNIITPDNNSKDYEKEDNLSNKKHKSQTIKNINEDSFNHKPYTNIKNIRADSQKNEYLPCENRNNDNQDKEDNSKFIQKNDKKKEEIIFNSQNINNNENKREQNERTNSLIEDGFNINKNNYTKENKINDKEKNVKRKNEIENMKEAEQNNNDVNYEIKNTKNNPKNKKELPQNQISEQYKENEEYSIKGKKEGDNIDINNKKQKILKLLLEKKNNNSYEENNVNDTNNGNEEFDDEEREKENNIIMKYDYGSKNKRRKKISPKKTDFNNFTFNNKMKESEKKDNKGKSTNKKESSNIDEKEYNEKNDSNICFSPNSKNKLSINIKSKNELTEEDDENRKKEINEDEENNNIDNNKLQQDKTKALFNILEKLKQKKALENTQTNYINNELNKDEEIEEIEKKSEKIKEEKKNNLIKKEEKEIRKNKNCYKKMTNKREAKKSGLNNEELEKRKKLKVDLRDEINQKESFNEFKDDEISTVQNSSKLINNSYSNKKLSQPVKEKKTYNKETNYKKNNSIRNNSNVGNRYKNLMENTNPKDEIIVNDLPTSNLDKSFDTANTYIKRRVPKSSNSINIYKPKKINNNIRNKTLIENNSNSVNPNQNIFLNNSNNIFNSPSYCKNNYSKSNKKTNTNFCEYPLDNSNPNYIRERNNIDMDINEGGPLNSSFDAYMKANMNNLNRNNNQNIFNVNNNLYYGIVNNKFNSLGYNQKRNIPNDNFNKNITNINTYINNNYYRNEEGNKSIGYLNNGVNNNIFDNNNDYNINNYKNINNHFNRINNQQFCDYNKNNNINKNLLLNNNLIPLRTYGNKPLNDFNDIYDNDNNIFNNSTDIPRRFTSSHINQPLNDLNQQSKINNYILNTSPSYQSNQNTSRKDTSINIEDLLVLEEKYRDIIIALKRNKQMHNECFEFWNYYYNCSLYGHLEKLFKLPEDSLNVQISIKLMLISIMICYDYSYEIDILNGDFSILEDILSFNHQNLIIIFEHILSKISSESKSNIWVHKLRNLIDIFNKKNINNLEYNKAKDRHMSPVDKIVYNKTVIIQNIRVLLKNYKTSRINYLTSIFKKINDKTYEEINTFFRENILRTDNLSGSVLASVFLKENKNFQTEPAPYIKTKNRKPYSLILDLDETLIHFKVNNEDESEGVLQIRPGVIQFLEQVGKYYELIIFTAATQDYGDLLIDSIEENNLYFEHRFYRQHTVIIGNDFVKDLTRIGRPLDKMIIVDNMPQNFRLQKENGINIKAFWGEDENDNALEELGIILTNIAKEGGDLRIGLMKYRDEIIRKVTSNISKNNY